MKSIRRRAIGALVLATAGATLLAACGSDSGGRSSGAAGSTSKTVTLVSHDSFAASKSVLAEFTKETGYTVKVLRGGDAGAAVNQAILTKDHPRGDVFFGVDNTLLSRALSNGLFDPYTAKDLGQIPPTCNSTPAGTASPPSTPGTSASTTTAPTSPRTSSSRRRPSPTW